MDRCRYGQKGMEMEKTCKLKFCPHDFLYIGDDTFYIDDIL